MCDTEDRPHPLDGGITMPTLGADLFLNPVQNVVPPIGHGLRRVLSVEVLFSSDEYDAAAEERVKIRAQSLSRVSSVPSLCSSILSPSSPISIPSRKRLSTDRSSSGIGMSPATPLSPYVFSLPSMQQNKPRPLSRSSLASSSDYGRQSSSTSLESSIHIITAGGNMSPSATSFPRKKIEPSQLAQNKRQSDRSLVATTAGHQDRPGSEGCGLSTATPPENWMVTSATKTPPTDHQTPPISGDKDLQATPPVNKVHQQPYQSSPSYADYGLESENDRMTEWKWAKGILLASPLLIAAGLALAYLVFRAKK